MKEEDERRLNDEVPPELLIKYLIKEKKEKDDIIKSLKQEIGEQESYIQELEDYIKSHNIRKIKEREYSKELKREELYKTLNSRILKKNKKIIELTNIRDRLFNILLKNNITVK